MAQLCIEIPDGAVSRVVDAVCADGNWTPATGVEKREFARQRLIRYLRSIVAQYEGRVAADAARGTAENDAKQIAFS